LHWLVRATPWFVIMLVEIQRQGIFGAVVGSVPLVLCLLLPGLLQQCDSSAQQQESWDWRARNKGCRDGHAWLDAGCAGWYVLDTLL